MDVLQILVYVITIAVPCLTAAVKIGQYTRQITDLTKTVENINQKLSSDFKMLQDHEIRIFKLEQKGGEKE